MQIRLACADDAPLIASLSQSTFLETFGDVNTPANMEKFFGTQFNTEMLEQEVREPGSLFYLAFEEDRPLGYLRMRDGVRPAELGDEPSIEIARIYSIASSIGKGVGKMLMQRAIETAYQLNRKIIWLGVWEKNQRAIDFYHRWGFEKFGEHDFLLGEDVQTDWLMKKHL